MSKSPFASFPQGPPQVPKVAVDRMAKMIEVGHLVMFHSPNDLIFEVVDIRPVLNPSMPNAMQVTLAATLNMNIAAAQPCQALVIVGESKARQEAKAAGNGALGSIGPETPALVLTDMPGVTGDRPATEAPSRLRDAHIDGDSGARPDPAPTGICDKCGDETFGALAGKQCDSCGVGTVPEGLMFPQMVKVVPEGKHGVAEIRHVTVSDEQSRMTALGGYRSFVEAGQYAQLFVTDVMVMSDTGYERRTNNGIVQQAHGRVLVGGYGLGMILTKLLKKPDVDEVVVVEKFKDVVTLVDPHIRAHVGAKAHRKLNVIVSDIYEAKDRVKDDRFDAIWFDIWADCSTDVLAEMTALTRKFRSLKRSTESFMECWDREWLRYRKSQERRMGW